MSRFDLARYVAPWKFRREQDQRRLAGLRERDGDNCRRCRRPIRFDLPPGHDNGPKIEAIPGDDFCLCHGRCHAAGADKTDEVTERIRRKAEAAVLSKPRKARKRAAASSR